MCYVVVVISHFLSTGARLARNGALTSAYDETALVTSTALSEARCQDPSFGYLIEAQLLCLGAWQGECP